MLGPQDIGNTGSPPRLGKELTDPTEINRIEQNETEECVPSEGMRHNFRKRMK